MYSTLEHTLYCPLGYSINKKWFTLTFLSMNYYIWPLYCTKHGAMSQKSLLTSLVRHDKDRPANNCQMCWLNLTKFNGGRSKKYQWLNDRTSYINNEATTEYSNLYPGNKEQCHIWLLGPPWRWIQQTPPKFGTHPPVCKVSCPRRLESLYIPMVVYLRTWQLVCNVLNFEIHTGIFYDLIIEAWQNPQIWYPSISKIITNALKIYLIHTTST